MASDIFGNNMNAGFDSKMDLVKSGETKLKVSIPRLELKLGHSVSLMGVSITSIRACRRIVWLFAILCLLHASTVFAFSFADRVQCTVNLNVLATARTSGTLIINSSNPSSGVAVSSYLGSGGYVSASTPT